MELGTITLSAIEDRAHFDPIRRRLRWMRKRHESREELWLGGLLAQMRRIGEKARTDWIKAKVRWFIEDEDIDTIRANCEVEKSLGRVEKELWTGDKKVGHTELFRMDFLGVEESTLHTKPTGEFARIRLSQENWKHSIDPMMANDREMLQGIRGVPTDLPLPDGKELTKQSFDFEPKRIAPTEEFRKLRLLEIRKADGDGKERLAEEVIQEIKMLCMDSEAKQEMRQERIDEGHNFGMTAEFTAVLQ